jgi:hypothetical protein
MCAQQHKLLLPHPEVFFRFFLFWRTAADPTDKLLATPSQAQWQGATRAFTCTPDPY